MADETLLLSLRDGTGELEPLLTMPGGVGLYRRRTRLELQLVPGKGLSADVVFEGCSFRPGLEGDSFIGLLVPPGSETREFDFGIHWDERGATVAGSAMLEFTLPITAKTPIVQLQAFHVIIQPQLGNASIITVELSADVKGSLSIFAASVARIGVTASFFVDSSGNAVANGPLRTSIKFKPPSGAALEANLAGVVQGGGALDIDPAGGRYSGVLSLTLFGIGVTAIGIILAKPDQFSLLLVITANFRPVGLDIGLGFTINAIGGILGLNRGIDLHALGDAVRNNAIASVLFPANPIADAPRIVRDLDRLFPPVPGHFVVGPMIEMGWGKPTGMLTLSLGVMIEVPDPKIAIVGIVRVLVPPLDVALLKIQANLVGSIDMGLRFVRFHATLFDSRLAMYSLEGDFVARLRWGADANFLASAGGFHPDYQPAADLDVPAMRRIAISLLPLSDNPRIRLESYYAVSSNTLQHGARVEAYAGVGPFSLRGFLEYDILAQVSPLYLEAHFGALVGIYFDDDEIMGLQLNLNVSGPSPWHVDGEVSFKPFPLVPRVRIPVRATFGDENAPAVLDVDVAKVFRDQLKNSRNWKAVLPDAAKLLVQLAERLKTAEFEVLAHPSATIEFNQHAVPLRTVIQRFGAGKPAGPNQFDLEGMDGMPAIARLQTEFAPAQYFEIPADLRLSAPAFVPMDSGIQADPARLVGFGGTAERICEYAEDVYDPAGRDLQIASPFRKGAISLALAQAGMAGSSVARSDLYRDRVAALPTGDEVKVSPGAYRIVEMATLQPVTAAAHSNAIVAYQAMGDLLLAQPGLSGSVMVVAELEMV